MGNSGLRLVAALIGFTVAAHAGGPRFVTGPAFAVSPGGVMAFRTASPLYFTDPGALGVGVSHAQADAMVAAAAAVWNVPTSMLVLAQGGALAEHVDASDAWFDGSGVVFPQDVMAANYLAKPIAVIYDTDGSVTDMLLGQGASDPSGCRQAGVTQSVDAFGQSGTIDHAVIVLNGRCLGALPQSLLQMQYQLTRAFGRVLGLAWAQVNDNVFTGTPTPTAAQMANWPVMHPLDVICGSYTYQCMVNPFLLRADDVASLAMLYPVTSANLVQGKALSLSGAVSAYGPVMFPTGQGMQLVNITVRRLLGGVSNVETWDTASAVSGFAYVEDAGNPVTRFIPSAEQSGSSYPVYEGFFSMPRIPIGSLATLLYTVESINPLYVGEYALGAYERPPETRSGPVQKMVGESELPGNSYYMAVPMQGAAAVCAPGHDGMESDPAAADASGWWSGQICSTGHVSWASAAMKAGRTATVEVTALDEAGAASLQKLQPVLGAWNASDALGTLPTVAATAAAMNSRSPGMTTLSLPAAASDVLLRLAVADQFGGGRPDFNYEARLLYADSIEPAVVGEGGGTITIVGCGFRQGNRVLVNGVSATVSSWTATQIVAIAPTMMAAGKPTAAVDVTIFDAGTGGSTTMTGALSYSTTIEPVRSVTLSATAEYVAAGASGAWSLTLQATQDGVAAAGVPVVWTAAGVATQATTVATDANGSMEVSVRANTVAPGSTNVLTGCLWTSVCASWTLYGVDASLWRIAAVSGAAQSVGVSSKLGAVMLLVTDAVGHVLPGATATIFQTVYAWEMPCGAQGRCPAAPVLELSQSAAVSDTNGLIAVTPLQVAGMPQVVAIAVASGTQGFAAARLVVSP